MFGFAGEGFSFFSSFGTVVPVADTAAAAYEPTLVSFGAEWGAVCAAGIKAEARTPETMWPPVAEEVTLCTTSILQDAASSCCSNGPARVGALPTAGDSRPSLASSEAEPNVRCSELGLRTCGNF